MSLASDIVTSGTPHPRRAWPHLVLIAALMVSRRPDAVLHPQFWAEDGQVFYHDAYMTGWPSLLQPRDGYLQTLSRLTALFATNFPLAWAPAIFAAVAFAVQLLPLGLLLSRRLEAAWPSWRGRLALAYFYTAIPNSYELDINLTNAQWHLAAAAFLLVAGAPAASSGARKFDAALLLLTGLTGPFAAFLAPIAWAKFWPARAVGRLGHVIILTVTAVLQFGCILALHATSARLVTPLGASFAGFCRIVTDNIVVGGLLGDRLMRMCLRAPWSRTGEAGFAVTALAGLALFAALRDGPRLLREAAVFAALVLGAALLSPVSSSAETALQWPAMGRPGYGMRYEFFPTLVWFGAVLVLWRHHRPSCRGVGGFFLALACLGALGNWIFPGLPRNGFTAAADSFAAAPAGTVARFQENPPAWVMVLVKK